MYQVLRTSFKDVDFIDGVTIGCQSVKKRNPNSSNAVKHILLHVCYQRITETKMSLFDLTGKVAIVTGGARGIGFALASGLAKAGAAIALADLLKEEVQDSSKALREKSLKSIPIHVDVSSPESVENMAEQTIKEFDKIDILINNAGVSIGKAVEDTEEEDWNFVMDVNLKGPFVCSKAVGRYMIQQKSGKIINITSVVERLGADFRSAYCASKGGLGQLTKVLAIEWGKHNINVNAVAPGLIRTPTTEAYEKTEPGRYDKILNRLPLRRWGKPEDLIGTVVFLASGASDYVTGQTIFVDAGWTIT
jgi:NAD(P)-dependent dehydrogenase (short-subunit alcohol dehydrogenase family)